MKKIFIALTLGATFCNVAPYADPLEYYNVSKDQIIRAIRTLLSASNQRAPKAPAPKISSFEELD